MRRKCRKFKAVVIVISLVTYLLSSMTVLAAEKLDNAYLKKSQDMFSDSILNNSVLNIEELEYSTTVDNLAVFPLFVIRTDGSVGGFIHCYYACDSYYEGNCYFLSSLMAAAVVQSDCSLCTIINNEVYEVTVIGYDSHLTYLDCAGLEDVEPIDISDVFLNDDLYVVQTIITEEDTFAMEAAFTEIGAWEECDGYYDSKAAVDGNNINLLGVPAFDEEYGELVGMLDVDFETTQLICRDMTSVELSPKYALANVWSEESVEDEQTVVISANEEPVADEPVEEEPIVEEGLFSGVPGWAYAIVIIVIIGVIVIKNNQKKDKIGSASKSASSPEGTIALDTGVTKIQEEGTMTEAKPEPKWQIRGINGIFMGQTFAIEDVLRFGRNSSYQVVFPEKTKGISGNHCEISMENERIILRDLGSSYGTYLKTGEKLNNRVSYELKEGDIFYLADSSQSFRVERIGESRQEFTPSVKAIVNPKAGEIYRADANGRIQFGRAAHCQVSFGANDTKISTNHCVLYRENEVLYLMDLGSTNGTFFEENKRLQPNVAYRVEKGTSFYLTSQNYLFVIVED